MKKSKYLIISGIIAVLIACAGIGTAWAYFTTYTRAAGWQKITLGEHTEIEEGKPTDWTKHITVKNKDDSVDSVYARVKAFAGGIYELKMQPSEDWVDGEDGWYYYTKLLAPGEVSSVLDIKIEGIKEDDLKPGDKINVAVVYETVAVQYDDSGNELPYSEVDWTPAYQEDLRVEG